MEFRDSGSGDGTKTSGGNITNATTNLNKPPGVLAKDRTNNKKAVADAAYETRVIPE